MTRSRRGTIHQGLVNSVWQGMQCTMVATMAWLAVCLNGYTFEHWNPRLIDSIVQQGSQVYDNVITNSANNYPRYLAHNEVPQCLDAMNVLFQIAVHDGLLYGVISHRSSQAAM